ncbi:MAG TPA: TAT-variant-translocated molybdopterin oxidoreductase, partial [Thermoanaerobaculia bacterium]|nr:TAT-variant-translocated molybdopterin oxidoreductase [Thermoanaerobaculia bacterium]
MHRLKILDSDERGGSCGLGCGCASEATAGTPARDLTETPEQEDRERASLSHLEGGRGIEGEGGDPEDRRPSPALGGRGIEGEGGDPIDRDPKNHWRSLEELAGTAGFEEMLHRELPRFASEWAEGEDGFSRRRFLQLSSASLALAGLAGCTRQPPESIVPYVQQPEQVVPGDPLYFATAFAMGGYAQGILVESHTGRPTKIEGNPEHPANPGGGTDLYAQASILQLYDPDRSPVLTYLGEIRSWRDFQQELAPRVRALRALGGAGLRILTGTVTSPTLAAQLAALLEALPEARWYQYEPAGRHNVHRGAVRAFGLPVEVRYDLARADVVLALDSDLLSRGPSAVRHAHDWAERRRSGVAAGSGRPPGPGDAASMNRLYVLEPMPSNTGSVADHRLAARPSEIARFALALAAELGVGGAERVELAGEAARWLPAVAEDLRAHRGRALVVAGDEAPPALHVLAHAINDALGAFGSTVHFSEPAAARAADQLEEIRTLAEELRAGQVDTLLVLGANPAFDAPADLDFASALTEAGLRVHAGLYRDETSQYCQWHVPLAHFLESWGDER